MPPNAAPLSSLDRPRTVSSPGAIVAGELEAANPCALCPNAGAKPRFEVDRTGIVACNSCGLVRQETRPRATGDLYDAAYYSTDDPKGGYSNYFLDASVNERTFRRRMRSIEQRLPRRGRILDVGCALGDFVQEAVTAGWDAEGVEISPFAAAQARKRGLKVRVGKLEDLRLDAEAFDVITLYDTIEHLPDPVATLREVRRLLRPGGFVHIVTPNVGGLQSRVLGRRWYHYKPGEHLFYFAPRTLRATIERAGLRWGGWARSGSYLTLTYVFSRLRYYAPRPFGALEWLGRKLRFGPFTFYLYVGEMEAWAVREGGGLSLVRPV
jgi:SAM-dependent methyltransferase